MESDPLRDPQYPNRPQTPEFWKLSEIVLKYDGRVAESTEREQVFTESVEEFIDLDSLGYMAVQRALRITNNPDQIAKLASMYVEAFVVGATYERERTT